MSNKFVAKNTAIKNITGKNSSIKYLQEKTTAFSIFIAIVIILLLISKCDPDTKKTSSKGKLKGGGNDTIQDTVVYNPPKPEDTVIDNTPKPEDTVIDNPPKPEDTVIDNTPALPKEKGTKPNNPTIVQTNFTRGNDNIIQWSSDLTNNAKQILITIKEKDGGKVWVNDSDVTGQASYLFNPGNPRAGGKAMIVTLTVIPNKGIKLMGLKKLEPEYFECSGE